MPALVPAHSQQKRPQLPISLPHVIPIPQPMAGKILADFQLVLRHLISAQAFFRPQFQFRHMCFPACRLYLSLEHQVRQRASPHLQRGANWDFFQFHVEMRPQQIPHRPVGQVDSPLHAVRPIEAPPISFPVLPRLGIPAPASPAHGIPRPVKRGFSAIFHRNPHHFRIAGKNSQFQGMGIKIVLPAKGIEKRL